MEYFGIWFSCIVGAAVIISIGAHSTIALIIFLRERYAKKHWETATTALIQELNSIERWCSYDFPIINDFCRFLRINLAEGVRGDVSKFRDDLRLKYKVGRGE